MAKIGDIVELVSCTDEFTKLVPGDRGKVTLIDDLGTVHINWDNGSMLGLIPGEDIYKIIETA